MDYERLTVKAQGVLQDAAALVHRSENPTLDPEHLLLAMVEQEDGVIPPLLDRIGVRPADLGARVRTLIERKPRMEGASAQPQLSPQVSRIFVKAEDEAKALGDEYVSTEHILLAMLRAGSGVEATSSSRRPSARCAPCRARNSTTRWPTGRVPRRSSSRWSPRRSKRPSTRRCALGKPSGGWRPPCRSSPPRSAG